MRTLLRTPKTRAGLVAAMSFHGFDKAYVQGWLSKATSTGSVIKILGSTPNTEVFVLTGREVNLPTSHSNLPTWMAPTIRLPHFASRRVFRMGELHKENHEQEQKQEGSSSCKTRIPRRGSSST